MISICAPVFDIDGQLVSTSGKASAKTISRRASRVATLDGSAVLVDGGYSAADLTYQLTIPDADGSRHLALSSMLAAYQTAVLSCERGCYSVLLSGLGYDRGKTTVTAEVLEDLG